MKFNVICGDITKLKVDVIVNAANRSLMGGGGVDGAIHRAAGPELLNYLKRFNGIKTSEVVITPGFNLPCRYIIHTAGPIFCHYEISEAKKLLASCYRNSIELCKKNNLSSIAFPAISCGVYGFPFELASSVVEGVMKEFDYDLEVTFVFRSDSQKAIYSKIFG